MEIHKHTLRACHNAPTVGSDINTGDSLVVTLELILELVVVANPAVQLNSCVSSNGKDGMIGRKGVIGNWAVKEVVNFGGGHDDYGI